MTLLPPLALGALLLAAGGVVFPPGTRVHLEPDVASQDASPPGAAAPSNPP